MSLTIHPTKLSETFKNARNKGVPILGVETPDQPETIKTLAAVVGVDAILTWDCVRGLTPENDAARAWIAALEAPRPPKPNQPPAPPFVLARTIDFTTAVDVLVNGTKTVSGLPEGGCVFAMNAHRVVGGPDSRSTPSIQAVTIARDPFKEDGRTLVLLAPSLRLPTELVNDVLVFAEALPDDEAVRKIINDVFEQGKVTKPDAPTLDQLVDATIGLSAFAVEQVTALSLRKAGVDKDELWSRKISVIEQTEGLSVYRGKEQFTELQDVDGAAEFVRDLSKHWSPRVVMWLDEIEKSIAGFRGDTSGVAQDQVGQLLSWSDGADGFRDVVGLLLMGAPGTGKSAFAKAAGSYCGAPTVKFDLGAMQNELVGGSQARIRHGLSVVDAVGQGRVLMIATCNGLEAMPPELRRRFKYGLYYFDLPTDRGMAALWAHYMKTYKLAAQPLPVSTNWTGAEVKACCEISARTKKPLTDAARKIVSIYRSNPGLVEGLRQQAVASGFVDARTGDSYVTPSTAKPELALPVPSNVRKRDIKLES